MSEKLRKKAIHFLDCRDYFEEEFAYRPPHAYDKEMLLDHFTDFAAECVRAERERADNLQQECDDVYERLSWILAACTIDRDAKNEIEAILKGI